MNGPTFAQSAPAATRTVPARPTPARPAVRPTPEGGDSLRILTYLKLHWLMILFCGTLLGGAGAYAASELLQSKYESTALLQADQVPWKIGSNNANEARTDFVTYVKTQTNLIKSDFVLTAALREIKDLPTIRAQRDPIKFLSEELQVSASDGSEVIKLVLAGHNPTDTRQIVDAVQKAYLKEVVQNETKRRTALNKKVEEAMQAVQKSLEQRTPRSSEQAKGGGATKAGPAIKPSPSVIPVGEFLPPGAGQVEPANLNNAPGPLPPLNQGAVVPVEPLIAQPGDTNIDTVLKFRPEALFEQYLRVQNEMEQLPVEIRSLEKQFRAAEAKLKTLREAPIDDPVTIAAVDKDPEVQNQAKHMENTRTRYLTFTKPGVPDTPKIAEFKKAWESAQEDLTKIRSRKAIEIESAKRTPEGKAIVAEMESLKARIEKLDEQYKRNQMSQARLQKTLDEMPASALGSKMSKDGRVVLEKPYDLASTELTAIDSLFAQLVRNYQLSHIELNSDDRIRILQPASAPMQKDTKKQIIGTIAAALMGFLLVGAGAIGFEMSSRWVSSLGDAKSAGPAQIVGVIPCRPGEALGKDPLRRAAATEAIDKLRSYVAQSWLSRGASCVAITSPLGDEGKAFASFGLASSLSQAGYKTLLVDFDLRDPALHLLVDVPNQNGISEILRGEVEVRSAVQSLPNGLDFIPAGKWSDESRKASGGGRVEALINRLKTPYDCVIFHSHALLTAAESIEVARRCEVVLVCALYRETTVPLLRKATDRVAAMEVPYTGVVYLGSSSKEALC